MQRQHHCLSILFALLCQYLYFCASRASTLSPQVAYGAYPDAATSPCVCIRCHYLYFCTSKASKLRVLIRKQRQHHPPAFFVHFIRVLLCQYLYFFTSKASKLSTHVQIEAPVVPPQPFRLGLTARRDCKQRAIFVRLYQ